MKKQFQRNKHKMGGQNRPFCKRNRFHQPQWCKRLEKKMRDMETWLLQSISLPVREGWDVNGRHRREVHDDVHSSETGI